MAATSTQQPAPRKPGTGMLVLARKEGETIIVNGEIIITVIEIRGDKVRLGINAPRHIPVHRQEIHELLLSGTLPTPPMPAPHHLVPAPPLRQSITHCRD